MILNSTIRIAIPALIAAVLIACGSASDDSGLAGGDAGTSGTSNAGGNTGDPGGTAGASAKAGSSGSSGSSHAGGFAGVGGGMGGVGGASSGVAGAGGTSSLPGARYCGSGVPCNDGATCALGSTESLNQCECDVTGHFLCTPQSGSGGGPAFTCVEGAECDNGTAGAPTTCTVDNGYCNRSCTCDNNALVCTSGCVGTGPEQKGTLCDTTSCTSDNVFTCSYQDGACNYSVDCGNPTDPTQGACN